MSLQIENGVLQKYIPEEGETSVIVPAGVKKMKSAVFMDCAQLQSIELPDGLEKLPYRTCKNCTALRRVILPDSIQDIGEGAFANCGSLSALRLPAALQHIEIYAFYGCAPRMQLTLPDGKQLRICMEDTYQNSIDTYAMKQFLCTSDGAKRSALLMEMTHTPYRYAAAPFLVQNEQASPEVLAWLKRNVTRIMKYAITQQDAEAAAGLLQTGFVTKKNIDKLLEFAISSGATEIQILLADYKNEQIGYTDPAKKFRL